MVKRFKLYGYFRVSLIGSRIGLKTSTWNLLAASYIEVFCSSAIQEFIPKKPGLWFKNCCVANDVLWIAARPKACARLLEVLCTRMQK